VSEEFIYGIRLMKELEEDWEVVPPCTRIILDKVKKSFDKY
jgi:hypothetical protein